MPKKFLTVNEVAKIIGVTPLTVRNWDKKGGLVACRNPVNNYRVYRVEDIENFLKSIQSPVRKMNAKPEMKKLRIEMK